MRWMISLLVAVLVGYSLSIVINASVIASTLVGFGIEVSLSDRPDMIVKEWVGLGTIYLPLYLILHATCFWLLGLVLGNRVVTIVVARATYGGLGALSLMAFYLTFDAVMGSSGVDAASTRITAGLVAHAAKRSGLGRLIPVVKSWVHPSVGLICCGATRTKYCPVSCAT